LKAAAIRSLTRIRRILLFPHEEESDKFLERVKNCLIYKFQAVASFSIKF